MMTRFFLLTIFLLHYGPVYAGWLAVEKQHQLIGPEALYFAQETIHRNGIRATLWQLTNLKWNNTTRLLSTKTHKEFDCEHPRVLVLQVINFSRQMGTGRSKPGYVETGSWQPAIVRGVRRLNALRQSHGMCPGNTCRPR